MASAASSYCPSPIAVSCTVARPSVRGGFRAARSNEGYPTQHALHPHDLSHAVRLRDRMPCLNVALLVDPQSEPVHHNSPKWLPTKQKTQLRTHDMLNTRPGFGTHPRKYSLKIINLTLHYCERIMRLCRFHLVEEVCPCVKNTAYDAHVPPVTHHSQGFGIIPHRIDSS